MSEKIEEKPYHYFGSTAFDWAVGVSVEDVLVKLAKAAGAHTIQVQVKGTNKGLYAWTCKVNAPHSTRYAINFFQPQGVEVTDGREFTIQNLKGHCLPITRPPLVVCDDPS